MGLRGAVAQQQGITEEIVTQVATRQDAALAPRHAAAAAVADAFLGAPGAVTAEGWHELTSVLSEDEVVVIVLRLTLFSRNKVRVALGFDDDAGAPPRTF
jgi:hypothetical protein